MTEDRKSETPVMTEVSAKFGGMQAASTDEALSALGREHERLTAQYSETIRQTDQAMTARQAIADIETPEYRAADTALEAANAHQEEVSINMVATENRMAKMPARTIAGALLKLRVVGIEITGEFIGRDGVLDETLLGSVERLSLSALADLERLPVLSALLDLERISSGSIAPEPPAVPTTASDPVTQSGRDLAAVWRLMKWNDEHRLPADAPAEQRSHRDHLDAHLTDRLAALETMAAEIQAGTLEGAMIQIMLAHAEADVMAASTEESNEAQMRTISKLLYSALAAIEKVADVPREELGGKAYLTRELDPHVLMTEAMTEKVA